ncbi:MAG: PAS domain-containing protein [Deltaproteobacteria bacterium]|nr:PAS domain-containing protein [Deltaproteobacteria bacterium]
MPRPPSYHSVLLASALRTSALGALVMIAGSSLQKLFVGAPFTPLGYVFPVSIGLIGGGLLGILHGRTLHALSLAEAERARFKELVDTLPVSILQLRPTGECTEVNLRGPGLYGISREALLERPFSRFLTEVSRKADAHCLREAMERGESRCEVTLIDADGATRPIARITRVLRDPKGAVTGMLCVDQDLSQLRLSERQAYRHLTALRQVEEGVLIAELQGQILFANPHLAEHLTVDDLTGRPLDALYDVLPADTVATLLASIGAGRPARATLVRQGSGSSRRILISGSPVLDTEGQDAVVFITRDITNDDAAPTPPA